MPAYAPAADALFDLPTVGPVAPPRPARRPAVPDPGRAEEAYGEADRFSYLGAHHPGWLAREEFGGSYCVPLCVSHRRLAGRRTLPRAVTSWMLDSGGYTELNLYGEWTVTPAQYAAAVRRYADEIGELERAAIQDWMCEPHVLAKTRQSVYDHQARTVASYINLLWRDGDLPWMPVLQGWTRDDYLRCVDMYAAMGVDLTLEPLVGIGSVCRRQSTREAVRIVEELYGLGIRLHGLGFKVTGLRAVHHLLYSSDSLAWSYEARNRAPLPGCSHQSCSNCPRYALAWRNRMLRSLPEWQQMTAVPSAA